jgi:hypothetical protein
VRGAFAANGSQAISEGPSENLATVNGFTTADVSVSADVNVSGAVNTTTAAVVVRCDGSGNAYIGGIANNGTSNSSVVFIGRRRPDGTFTPLVTTPVSTLSGPVFGDVMGTVRLDVFGTSLKLYLNGILMLSATDSTLTAPGSVGMEASNAGVTFDNFSTYTLTAAGLPFADNFNRPASTTLGAPWSVESGGFTINSSHQAAAASTTNLDAAALVGVLVSSSTVQATITGVGGGVLAQWNSATQSGYALVLTSSTTVTLFNVNTTGGTTTLTALQSFTLGSSVLGTYSLKLVATPGSLKAFIDVGSGFTSLGTVLDGTYTSGSVGLASAAGGVVFSGFSATSP